MIVSYTSTPILSCTERNLQNGWFIFICIVLLRFQTHRTDIFIYVYLEKHFPLFNSRVVFNEVVQTSKYYMRDVTAVESSWLVELAPHFYKQAKVS